MEHAELDELRRSARRAAGKAGAPPAWVDDIGDEAVARYFAHADAVDKPIAWIRRAARNLAIDAHRREPPKGWADDIGLSDPGPGQRPYPTHFRAPSPSLVVRRRGQVDEVLAILTPIERELLVATAAGIDANELAERYGYTPASVRTKISAARKKIRDAFPDHENFDVT